MHRYYSPGDELLSITLIGLGLLLCAGQSPFNSIRTEPSKRPCGFLDDAISHKSSTVWKLLKRDATTQTTLMCKQLGDATAVYHILLSYSVHHMS